MNKSQNLIAIETELENKFNDFKSYYNYLLNFSKKNQIDIRSFYDLNFDKHYDFLEDNLNFNSIINDITLSIDYIKIFYDYSIINSRKVIQFLLQLGASVRPIIKSGRYLEVTLLHQGKTYQLFFLLVYVNNIYKGLSIRICHPDLDIIDKIEALFTDNYSLSCVEYSADIYSTNLPVLFRIISSTISQSYARSNVNKSYLTTYYCSNPRTAHSVGSYVYLKPEDNPEFVRLECRYKRPYFRENRLKMLGAVKAEPCKVFERINFKIFNLKRYLKKIFKKILFQMEMPAWLGSSKAISLEC